MKQLISLLLLLVTGTLLLGGCQPPHPVFKPKVGVQAIALENKMNPSGAKNGNLCTLDPPCSLHDHTVAEALAAHKPILLQFASPIHCTICDVQLKAVEEVKKKYGDRMVFIHVDGYKDPDAVSRWGHKGDPWCYIIDKNGVIQAVLPGSSIPRELESVVAKIMAKE